MERFYMSVFVLFFVHHYTAAVSVRNLTITPSTLVDPDLKNLTRIVTTNEEQKLNDDYKNKTTNLLNSNEIQQDDRNNISYINRNKISESRFAVLRERQRLYSQINTWAIKIKQYIRDTSCERKQFTTRGRCETVKLTPFKFMRFYIAPPRRNVIYSVALPDGSLSHPSSHHSVAIVDPFPDASYGHLVYIFYIDGSTYPWCRDNDGIYLDPSLCITHANKERCSSDYRGDSFDHATVRKCEVDFIPLVYDNSEADSVTGRHQRLQCLSRISGFGSCPNKTEVVKSNVKKNCEILGNNHNCYLSRTKLQTIPARRPCRMYQTCDHAVAVFGGWNEVTSRVKHQTNVRDMFTMLRRNGFKNQNIQVFYNGNGLIEVGEPYLHGLPASGKGLIRSHIDHLCSSPFCVDSLVLYINGPTTSDGDLLLWDKNGNGEADSQETYTIAEILNDVTMCNANLVYVFADQSHAGILANALNARLESDRESYSNIVLFSSSDSLEYAWDREATSHWARLTPLRSAAWTVEGIGSFRSKRAVVNKELAKKFTIYGAPITHGVPPHVNNFPLLKQKYMGCQILPPPSWRMSFLHRNTEPSTSKAGNTD